MHIIQKVKNRAVAVLPQILGSNRMRKIIFILLLMSIPNIGRAVINNTLAYSVSHTTSFWGARNLKALGTKTVAQTVRATATETWDGVVVYLDRVGFGSSTDSLKLRLRGGQGTTCGTPDTSGTPKRDAYVYVTDIPDGDGTTNTQRPDQVGRGYCIWFIFSSPISVVADSCYTFFLNAPYTDGSNQITFLNGENGYANGSSWHDSTGSWTDYGGDMNFKIIKDKYALVDVRRLPYNKKGAITICSDIDRGSIDYMSALHKWLNTTADQGGFWGAGLNGKIGGNDLWFGRGASDAAVNPVSGDSIPFYFSDLDTTADFKDSMDVFMDRRWTDCLHTWGDCNLTTGCIDTIKVNKYWTYMLNHSTAFNKLWKAGVWINHGDNSANLTNIGVSGSKGDSVGTLYYHTDSTLKSGRFKFTWLLGVIDPGSSSSQHLAYYDWIGVEDSLNTKDLPFTSNTFADGSKAYLFSRIGRDAAARAESTYKFFNLNVAKKCVDSNWLSIVYTHLGWNDSLGTQTRDSIRTVHDSVSSWGLWIPDTKQLLNQQAASAFVQATVDRPGGSKRRINITSMHDWDWGSHVPDKEELYYLTFIAYAPESLIVTLNASETLTTTNLTNQQEVSTTYYQDVAQLRPMVWSGIYNRTAGRVTIIETPSAINKKVMIRK